MGGGEKVRPIKVIDQSVAPTLKRKYLEKNPTKCSEKAPEVMYVEIGPLRIPERNKEVINLLWRYRDRNCDGVVNKSDLSNPSCSDANYQIAAMYSGVQKMVGVRNAVSTDEYLTLSQAMTAANMACEIVLWLKNLQGHTVNKTIIMLNEHEYPEASWDLIEKRLGKNAVEYNSLIEYVYTIFNNMRTNPRFAISTDLKNKIPRYRLPQNYYLIYCGLTPKNIRPLVKEFFQKILFIFAFANDGEVECGDIWSDNRSAEPRIKPFSLRVIE